MKILYHHRTQGGGAEGVHITEIINALRDFDHEVYVMSPPGVDIFKVNHDSGKDNKKPFLIVLWKFISKYVPQILFEFVEIFYNLLAFIKIQNMIKTKKIDCIYERYSFFCFSGVACAKRYKVPIVLEVNEISGMPRVRGQVLKNFARKIEKFNFLNASAIIVVSNYLKQNITSMIDQKNKIFVMPNGFNEKTFYPREINQAIVRKLALAQKTILGFIGGLVHWHNFKFLLLGLSDVVKEDKDIRLLIVGSGPMEHELKNAVKRMHLESNVIFIGKISHNQVPEYINLMDICIIPNSNVYRSPIKMFEYMGMAKPVLAPSLNPITDIIIDRNNGAIFIQNDLDSFTKALFFLINNPEQRIQMGEEARRTVLRNHTWNAKALQTLEIINQTKC